MSDLDKKIASYYNSRKLSPEQLKGIVEPSQQKVGGVNWYRPLAYAASILLLITTVYLFYFLPNQQNSILEQFAEEVAYNHKKQKPPKFMTSDVAELNQILDKLDFNFELGNRILSQYKLIGGKYCSVDNRIAVQLRLEDKDGNWSTCYIFKKKEDFSFDKSIINDKTEVELWDKDDLIYAIASFR